MEEVLWEDPPTSPGQCPSCRQAELRYFFWRYEKERSDDAGPASSRGGFWIWCPACRRFAHYSAIVPSWWRNWPEVPAGTLNPWPAWLDAHWDELMERHRGELPGNEADGRQSP